jgi:hypothetical protein
LHRSLLPERVSTFRYPCQGVRKIGLGVGLVGALAGGIITGPGVGLGIGLVGYTGEIRPIEALHWSWSDKQLDLGGRLSRDVVGALAYGLAWGVVGGLAVELVFKRGVGVRVGLGVWLVATVGALLVVLIAGLRNTRVEERSTPNQGIRRSARSALMAGLAEGIYGALGNGVVITLGVGLTAGLAGGLIAGLVAGLAGGLIAGGAACIRHFVLRFVLSHDGYIAINYVRFLNEAADRTLLRKVGGGYIFVHRLLLDYFADWTPRSHLQE